MLLSCRDPSQTLALQAFMLALKLTHTLARSPRMLSETSFGCRTSYVYGIVAEMLACSRARYFLGSPRSTFSSHIVAMRANRASTSPSLSLRGTSSGGGGNGGSGGSDYNAWMTSDGVCKGRLCSLS